MAEVAQPSPLTETELRSLLAAGDPSWVDEIVPHLLLQQQHAEMRPFLLSGFEEALARALRTANENLCQHCSKTNTDGAIVKLSVGGRRFETTRSTLTKDPDSMLAAMFSGRHELVVDGDGCVFIDQDGDVFAHVLSYLRSSSAYEPPAAEEDYGRLRAAAEFYQLGELVQIMDGDMSRRRSLAVEMDEAARHADSAAKAEVFVRERLKTVVAERLKRTNFVRQLGGERHSLWAAVATQFLQEEVQSIQNSIDKLLGDGAAVARLVQDEIKGQVHTRLKDIVAETHLNETCTGSQHSRPLHISHGELTKMISNLRSSCASALDPQIQSAFRDVLCASLEEAGCSVARDALVKGGNMV